MSRRRRNASGEFVLFSPDTTLGWRVARRIDLKRGESMIDDGVAVRVNDQLGNHIGYKLLAEEERKPGRIAPSVQSSICITPAETMAAVGLLGRSETKDMSEEQRLSRVDRYTRKVLPEEDFIERAEEKLRLYPLIGDRKAPLAALIAFA